MLRKYDLILTGDAKPEALKGAAVAMPISLPLPEITQSFLGNVQEEQALRLRGILESVLKSGCSSFTFEVADFLQRFALMNSDNISEEEAIVKVDIIATPFLEMLSTLVTEFQHRIETEQICLQLKITRWQENLNNGSYQKCKAIIDEAAKEESYLRAVGETALGFQKSSRIYSMSPRFMERVYNNNLAHVLEECKVYLTWSYNIILYPSKATPAIEETYNRFVKAKNTTILKYLTFKLSNTAKKHAEQIHANSKADEKVASQPNSSIAGDLFEGALRYLEKNPGQMPLCITLMSAVLKSTYANSSGTIMMNTEGFVTVGAASTLGNFGLFLPVSAVQSTPVKKSEILSSISDSNVSTLVLNGAST